MKLIKLLKGGIKYITDSDYRFIFNSSLGLYKNVPDKKYLERYYKAVFHKTLDLNNPISFNEKLQWLKLYDHKKIYTLMSDKYLVKQYVAKKIGNEHIIPLLGVWNKPEDIDFAALPDKFVLKCNHNSGLGMCICKDKNSLDIKRVKQNLKKGLKQNYYSYFREWNYKNIHRKIIAEQYMEDSLVSKSYLNTDSDGLIDYKFYCFNGIPKFLYVGFANIIEGEKHDVLSFLTMDWSIAPFYRIDHDQLPFLPPKPRNLDEMISYASILSKGIPFVRVDFFLINEKIYFSEFTFAPGAGYGAFNPEEWEIRIGEWIQLPNHK